MFSERGISNYARIHTAVFELVRVDRRTHRHNKANGRIFAFSRCECAKDKNTLGRGSQKYI